MEQDQDFAGLRPDEWKEVASLFGWAILVCVLVYVFLLMMGTFQ